MADKNGGSSASGSSRDVNGSYGKLQKSFEFIDWLISKLPSPERVAPAAKNRIAGLAEKDAAEHQEASRAKSSLEVKKKKRSQPAELSVARQGQEMRNNEVFNNQNDLDVRMRSVKKMRRVSFRKSDGFDFQNGKGDYIDLEVNADDLERRLRPGETADSKNSNCRDGFISFGINGLEAITANYGDADDSDQVELDLNLPGEIKADDDDDLSNEEELLNAGAEDERVADGCVGRSFKCRYCEKRYDNKHALGGHQKRHREQRKLDEIKKAMTGFDGDTSEFEKYALWREKRQPDTNKPCSSSKATKPADYPKLDTIDLTTPDTDDNGIDLTLRLSLR